MDEEKKEEVNYDREVIQADTVAKYLFAIMHYKSLDSIQSHFELMH